MSLPGCTVSAHAFEVECLLRVAVCIFSLALFCDITHSSYPLT